MEHENLTQRDLSQFEHVLVEAEAEAERRQEVMKSTATRGRRTGRGRAIGGRRRGAGRGRERGVVRMLSLLRCTWKQVYLQHFMCDCILEQCKLDRLNPEEGVYQYWNP